MKSVLLFTSKVDVLQMSYNDDLAMKAKLRKTGIQRPNKPMSRRSLHRSY